MLEAAVEAKNGRLYVIDGVLIPASITPVLPHRCDVTENHIVKVRLCGLLLVLETLQEHRQNAMELVSWF